MKPILLSESNLAELNPVGKKCADNFAKNLQFSKYGKLTLLEIAGVDKNTKVKVIAVCDCGVKIVANIHSIKSGSTSSCGCNFLKREITGHPLYAVLSSMINRTTNPNNIGYKYYGARGIKVCEEWSTNPESFLHWALENGYEKGLAIDRIDTDGDYQPHNCRFVTRKENNSNKRTNRLCIYNGETMTLAEASRRLGRNKRYLDYCVSNNRLHLIPNSIQLIGKQNNQTIHYGT